MKVNFKDSGDKMSYQISVDEIYVGDVRLNIFKQKWFVYPNFKAEWGFDDIKTQGFWSSYKAGKKLVGLYNFFLSDNFEEEQRFGISLDEVLSFLR